MFPLIFHIPQLPDLKSQKYTAQYGQGVRQKVLSSQKDFLLLLSDLGRVYNLTFSIRYRYLPGLAFDQRLAIYLVVSQSKNNSLFTDTSAATEIEQVITQGFLSQFYQLERIEQVPQIQSLNWVTCIGEAIKYEEIISSRPKDSLESLKKKGLSSYYVPMQLEAEEANDMLVVCQAIASFHSPLMLEITLEPDTTSLQEKSSWINSLDQMLSQLRQASSGSSLSSSREGDRNAQLVSRLYEKYQSSYLTESLYSYSFKVLGTNELVVRSVLGTLLLSGTKKSRYRTVIIDKYHPAFSSSVSATLQGTISLSTHWEEWDRELGEAEFGGDSITGKGGVRVADLKPLHRYATLNEISGLFRIVVPGDASVAGMRQENDITSLTPDKQWIDFGGYETTRPENTIQIKLEQLNKHAFICGVPGSGKTTTAFNILTQLWCQNIPFLVFEPAKTEYRSLLTIEPNSDKFTTDQLQKLHALKRELRVYTLGNDLISPFRFNPFDVSPGVPFYEHISNLEASFRGALPLSGPLPALLSEALEEIYYDRGWTGNEEGTPEDLQIPMMRDLYDKITALFATKDYAGEVKSNLKTALEVRIGSLLRRGVGAMLNSQKSSPTIADLLKYPTILELDYLNQDQANLMTFLLLTKIREYIKRQRTEKPGIPEHVILLEEAHNLVGRNLGASSADDANTKQEAANYVTRMLAEMRALREAIIIADQLPTAVAAEVVKNTNIKIAHRLVSADDRKDIGQAMLLDQSQTEEIARLNPGESFLYMEGWYRPRMVKIPQENSAKEKLMVESSTNNDKIKTLIQSYNWYIQGQQTVFETSLQEHHRLCGEYRQTFTDICNQLQKVSQGCNELQALLNELKTEVFYSLAGELRFVLNPIPQDELLLTDKRIKADNIHNFKRLQPCPNLTLSDLLELRSHLTTKLAVFDRLYQEVVDTHNRIPRDKYKHQWQKLSRQLQTLQQQVTKLAKFLDNSKQANPLKQHEDEIAYEQRRITDLEERSLQNILKQLQKDRQELQDELTKVLNRAVEQVKIDKVRQDLKLGGNSLGYNS
ncbi:ATP-binding protein [Nostoc sp.]|uniref:ATP-binding protein n=1 Tax=Nostoc sp. TaxID=1180 RepID=UPI002FF6E1AC